MFRRSNMNKLMGMKPDKRIMAVVLFMLTAAAVMAQDGGKSFGEASMAANNTGMYILGGWAVANMAAGAYGWAAFDGDKKYFSQMNIFWNVVTSQLRDSRFTATTAPTWFRPALMRFLQSTLKRKGFSLLTQGLISAIWEPGS